MSSFRLPSHKLAWVTRRLNAIESGLLEKRNDVPDLEEVVLLARQEIQGLEALVEEQRQLPELTNDQQNILDDWVTTNLVEATERFLGLEAQVLLVKRRPLSTAAADTWEKASHTSATPRSEGSICSNASSKVESAIKLAQLRIEKKYEASEATMLDEETRVREKLRHVEQEIKLLSLKRQSMERSREAEKESATISALDGIQELKKTTSEHEILHGVPVASSMDRIQSSFPFPEGDTERNLLRFLVEQQNLMQLPKPELIYFDGSDVSSYRTFISWFEDYICARTSSSSERFQLLCTTTKGDAHLLVQAFINFPRDERYPAARKHLDDVYGNPHLIVSGILQNLERLKGVPGGDGKALRHFSVELMTSEISLMGLGASYRVNSPEKLQSIASKLPVDLRKQWRRYSTDLALKGDVVFSNLVSFVKHEADRLNVPIFGELVDDRKISKSFNCTTETSSEGFPVLCIFCKRGKHGLERCFQFAARSIVSRKSFVRGASLCFSCLKPGHSSARCPFPLRCENCSGNHPSCFHDDLPSGGALRAESGPDVHQHSSGLSACLISSGSRAKIAVSMTPVLVSSPDGGKTVTTYAALDNFSSDCFISEDLARALSLKGAKTTLSVSTLEKEDSLWNTTLFSGLEVTDLDCNYPFKLPPLFSRNSLPFGPEHIPSHSDWNSCAHLRDVPFEIVKAPVGLLLGMNAPDLLRPLQIVEGPDSSPFAVRYKHGWAINGPVGGESSSFVHHVEVKKQIDEMIEQMFAYDFKDTELDEKAPSIEENRFLERAKSSIKHQGGHFVMDLPVRHNAAPFQDNSRQAFRRIQSTKSRLKADEKLCSDYCSFMQDMLERGFMEPVPDMEVPAEAWYIVHHAVYHKEKQKIRVVFDCSLKFQGYSLNDRLLKGPDLTNSLIGVLLRFRQYGVALQGDIEKMFYMVKVPECQRDLLRLFWFPDGDLDSVPVPYRLTVHVFGAVSSPACANFALRSAADVFGQLFPDVKDAIYRNFYVDDMLKSVPLIVQAKDLIHNVCLVLSKAGFNLTGLISSEREVVRSLPSGKAAKGVGEIDLDTAPLPTDKALGLVWNVEDDTLAPRVNVPPHESSKRGILKVIHSAYDPLGLVGPVLLKGKAVFQRACKLSLDWDTELPPCLQKEWRAWVANLPGLKLFQVPRCVLLRSDNISNQLHVFCDGSDQGYGATVYLRSSCRTEIDSNLIYAKSRLTPLKPQTIPRIELTAAHLGVRILNVLRKELDLEITDCVLWSDSQTVIRYILNETTNFHRFVANRVEFIRQHTLPEQWNYVPSEMNPADIASRGCEASLLINDTLWSKGPAFIFKPKYFWPQPIFDQSVQRGDPEVKETSHVCIATVNEVHPVDKLLSGVNSWGKAKRRLAWMLLLKKVLIHLAKKPINLPHPTMQRSYLEEAESIICKHLQRGHFPAEMELLAKGNSLSKGTPLFKISPFLDGSGVLRVGGRLANSSLDGSQKNPIVLPSRSPLVEILVRDTHRNNGHLGRERVQVELMQQYWIVGIGNLARRICKNCVICRRMHGAPAEQKMADLPSDRVKGDEPPFSCIGLDCFGPFHVTRGRGVEKWMGLIITCLQSRAVHLELLVSMDTSAFINAFRRFMARRGHPRLVRSDCGTNFIGAERELRSSWKDLCEAGKEFTFKNFAVEWIFNPPHSSHFGGVWEREIRTFRKIFNSILQEQKLKLTGDNLMTLFCEVEAIMNGRPLTPVSNDPLNLEVLTPNHLLRGTMIMFPPGLFSVHDCYARRRWRQMQYLAELFWTRWKREYLTILQRRHKWQRQQRNVRVGDLVLLIEPHSSRNQWPVGRIITTNSDEKGMVRSARIRTKTGEYDRPISKLVVIFEEES